MSKTTTHTLIITALSVVSMSAVADTVITLVNPGFDDVANANPTSWTTVKPHVASFYNWTGGGTPAPLPSDPVRITGFPPFCLCAKSQKLCAKPQRHF